MIVAKIAPHDCLGCGVEGSLLCNPCLQGLGRAPATCYHCKRPSRGGFTCEDCRRTSPLHSVRSATVYKGLAKDLIWRIKSSGAQAAAELMAFKMSTYVEKTNHTVVVAVPTATSRVRRRGYDQARLIARQLAIKTALPWMDCLKRSGQAHQVGASRTQRLTQVEDALRVSQKRFVRGAHIILVDDVVTTGATLEVAAKVLKQAGAARIEAITFAKTL